jgi:hypothetical protein
VTGKAAANTIWTPFSKSLRDAITAAAQPGSTCVIDTPLYAVNPQTGIHVKSGWLKVVNQGNKSLFELSIEVKDELGTVIFAGPVYVAVALTITGC